LSLAATDSTPLANFSLCCPFNTAWGSARQQTGFLDPDQAIVQELRDDGNGSFPLPVSSLAPFTPAPRWIAAQAAALDPRDGIATDAY
jgi:hypothetical protein